MAISWGAWEDSGGNGMRVGIEVIWDSVSGCTDTNVRATVRYYTQNRYRYNDSQTLDFSGSIGGTQDYSNTQGTSSSGGGAIHRATRTYTYTYGSTQYGTSPGTRTFGVTVLGAYNGVTPSKSVTVSIPARPACVPTAQTGVAATRVSDSQANLTWTRTATDSHPYASQTIQMRTYSGSTWSGWVTVVTASATATSYSQTGLSANRAYQFQIRANNGSGSSGWVSSDIVYMTPAAPSAAAASVVSSGSSIAVNWTNNHYSSTTISLEIERSVNGEAWTSVASDLLQTTTSWIDEAPGAGSNQYRIRARQNAPLLSGYATTNVVTTIVEPLAPSDLAPNGVKVDLEADDVTLTWRHNHGGDGSTQSHFRIEYSDDGGASWAIFADDVPSTLSHLVISAGTLENGVTYLWRVQTQGNTSVGYGPYSTAATFTGATRPTVAIDTPIGETTSLPLQTTWSYTQAEGRPQTEWRASLYAFDGVTQLEELTGTGATSSATFSTPVMNGITYVIKVQAKSADGIWSNVATRSTMINLLPPPNPVLTGEYDGCTGTTVLEMSVLDPEPGISEPTDYIDIARSIDDGPWVLIAERVEVSDGTAITLVDATPSTTGRNSYRAVAYASSGVSSFSNALAVDGTNADSDHLWIFLSYGPGFANILRFRGDPSTSATTSRNRDAAHFLGRRLPTLLLGQNIDKVISASGSISYDADCGIIGLDDCEFDSPRDDWETASWEADMVLYRDYTGRRVYGMLSDMATTDTLPGHGTVSFSVTQTEFDGIERIIDLPPVGGYGSGGYGFGPYGG